MSCLRWFWSRILFRHVHEVNLSACNVQASRLFGIRDIGQWRRAQPALSATMRIKRAAFAAAVVHFLRKPVRKQRTAAKDGDEQKQIEKKFHRKDCSTQK